MPKIIGICGPSGSGKSTIAKLLADKLEANVIGLDNYFLLETPHKKYGVPGKDLELPENTDWQAIHELVDSIHRGDSELRVQKVSWSKNINEKYTLKNREFSILEGFLLLHDDLLVKKLDLAVYIDVSDEVGIARRLSREKTDKNKQWFIDVTFPEYQARREAFKNKADLVLNGEELLGTNVELILERLTI